MRRANFRWIGALLSVAVVFGVLGLYRADRAVSQPPQLPFSNSVQQRAEMIKELKAIRKLLEEQNKLLRKQAQPHRDSSTRPTRSTATSRRR